jgi:hypothetical protein
VDTQAECGLFRIHFFQLETRRFKGLFAEYIRFDSRIYQIKDSLQFVSKYSILNKANLRKRNSSFHSLLTSFKILSSICSCPCLVTLINLILLSFAFYYIFFALFAHIHFCFASICFRSCSFCLQNFPINFKANIANLSPWSFISLKFISFQIRFKANMRLHPRTFMSELCCH